MYKQEDTGEICFQYVLLAAVWIPPYIDLEGKRITIESQDGQSSTYTIPGVFRISINTHSSTVI